MKFSRANMRLIGSTNAQHSYLMGLNISDVAKKIVTRHKVEFDYEVNDKIEWMRSEYIASQLPEYMS